MSCAYGEYRCSWSPCCVQDLGNFGVRAAGHALWAEVGGIITFVTSGENASQSIKLSVQYFGIFWDFLEWKQKMLASAGQPSLHGHVA